ncbi:spermatogenesis-associated protein 16-like [Acipenser oxyrinchus oxyrinchus]|uniref:Spermatogenesis-associated protein 16-like n=1 Tax=Acipenser oxyrinchus oxyrinchus TaxID=40147 RepID=A0AAD8G3G0_ACIOX|nr:spermatogenesis-associated protein 16-like [Acipenser oxyrinchus oxyrinchus]
MGSSSERGSDCNKKSSTPSMDTRPQTSKGSAVKNEAAIDHVKCPAEGNKVLQEELNNLNKRKKWSRCAKPKKRKWSERKQECEDESLVKKEAKNVSSDQPSLPRIPLRSLVDVEMKLVYGDEQNIALQFMKSQASSDSQLVCQATEIGSQSGSNLSLLPQIDKWLQVAVQDASSYYKQKKYVIAASRFTRALELCSKGPVLETPFEADYEDVSKVAGFIESKLVICYLRMKRPDLALNHSHRSIHLNPVDYQHHLRQATVFRLLARYSEAARSAMIADYMYWLSGGSEQHISKLIKLYWQAMLEEAITKANAFSVMYTPCNVKPTADGIEKPKNIFRKQHPTYTAYVFTDPAVVHCLPQTTNWGLPVSQQYMITLGFKKQEDGSFLEKLLTRKCPTFIGSKAPFCPLTTEETERSIETLGKRILPVLDFIKCTKLAGGFCAGSGIMEKLLYAGYLCRLQRVKEQSQVINQALAELAVIPYLQDISQKEAELLHALMADTMDTLEGNRTDKERVWNKMQTVGLIEDLIYQSEDVFLRNKELRTARKQKAKVKRTQSVKSQPSVENAQHSQDVSKMAAGTLIHPPPDSRDNKGLSSN